MCERGPPPLSGRQDDTLPERVNLIALPHHFHENLAARAPSPFSHCRDLPDRSRKPVRALSGGLKPRSSHFGNTFRHSSRLRPAPVPVSISENVRISSKSSAASWPAPHDLQIIARAGSSGASIASSVIPMIPFMGYGFRAHIGSSRLFGPGWPIPPAFGLTKRFFVALRNGARRSRAASDARMPSCSSVRADTVLCVEEKRSLTRLSTETGRIKSASLRIGEASAISAGSSGSPNPLPQCTRKGRTRPPAQRPYHTRRTRMSRPERQERLP